MLERLLTLGQTELANLLCLVLTIMGIFLGIVSIFELPGVDKQEAKDLGSRAFGAGISIGFGVTASNGVKRRQTKTPPKGGDERS
jgi:hypothetical protein